MVAGLSLVLFILICLSRYLIEQVKCGSFIDDLFVRSVYQLLRHLLLVAPADLHGFLDPVLRYVACAAQCAGNCACHGGNGVGIPPQVGPVGYRLFKVSIGK